MSKERELLERLLAYMCAEYLVITEFEMIAQIEDTVKEIQELLAQPEPEQEPVAWMWEDKRNETNSWATVCCTRKPDNSVHVKNVVMLYTPPTREPLSTKQAEDLWETTFKSAVPYYIFDEICTAIEQYHGIGVYDE